MPMDFARQWAFVADMNGDGAITISDVWLWVKWLFFYPGDLLLAGLMAGFPDVARFFEISTSSYEGFFSGVVGAIFWLIASFMILGAVGLLLELWEDLRKPSAVSAGPAKESRL